MKKYILLCAFGIISALPIWSQSVVLLLSNTDCTILIDGEPNGDIQADIPKKFNLFAGEHIITAKTAQETKNEIVSIEDSQQIIVKLEFAKEDSDLSEDTHFYLLTETHTSLSGTSNPSDPIHFAFEEGDRIRINAHVENKKGTFDVLINSYPDNNRIFNRQNIRQLEGQEILIKNKGIYKIELRSQAIFGRKVRLKVERKPANNLAKNFNTKVMVKTRYKTVEVDKNSFYLNSTSNELFKGGTNETSIPVKLPRNTIEWYYSFSASRNEQDIKQVQGNNSLFKDLTKILNGIDPSTAALNIGLDILSQPPGANYCDVYLLDSNNHRAFLNDQSFTYVADASRKNLKSSIVKSNCCLDDLTKFFLGIENDDRMHGIHVAIEIVAIVKETYLDNE